MSGEAKGYPYEDGGVIVLGPEIFAAEDRTVICWKGQNYVPMEDPDRPAPDPANWTCQVGEVARARLPEGSDLPMRNAVEQAYHDLVGEWPEYVFSGWGFHLPETYRAVVEDRLPRALDHRKDAR